MKFPGLLFLFISISLSAGATEPVFASPLDFILSSASQQQSQPEEASPLDRVASASPLDFVASSSSQGGNPFSALDYITSAYSGNGFYQSGTWGTSSGMRRFPLTPLPGEGYVLPATGRITSGFGFRPSFGRQHKGIDIAMAVGDTVRVALAGVVTRVSYEARGYGRFLVVTHDNGYETRYAHLSQALVAVGQMVGAGEPIALSGNTGNSTGPHLHFETRLNGQPVDPSRLFAFNGAQPGATQGTQWATQSAATSSVKRVDPSAPLAEKRTYIIRSGDNLTKISKKTGLSIPRLCQLNMLTEGSVLQVGRMLRLR